MVEENTRGIKTLTHTRNSQNSFNCEKLTIVLSINDICSSIYGTQESLEIHMKYYDQLVFDGKFKEVECLIFNRLVRLEDLSEEAFLLFKTWIEGS